jgi:hypothetical protein
MSLNFAHKVRKYPGRWRHARRHWVSNRTHIGMSFSHTGTTTTITVDEGSHHYLNTIYVCRCKISGVWSEASTAAIAPGTSAADVATAVRAAFDSLTGITGGGTTTTVTATGTGLEDSIVAPQAENTLYGISNFSDTSAMSAMSAEMLKMVTKHMSDLGKAKTKKSKKKDDGAKAAS